MATVTASEQDKIRTNPIMNRDGFRRTFDSIRSKLKIPLSSNTVQLVFSTATSHVIKRLVLDLILALGLQPAADVLSLRNNHNDLLSDLFYLGYNFHSSMLDIKLAIPLMELVVNDASGVEIWDAVFRLTSRLKQLRPSTFVQKANTKADEVSRKVDERILEEIWGRVYEDVGGFYERYFEGKVWSNNAEDIYEKSKAQYIQGRWSGWPESSVPGSSVPGSSVPESSVSGSSVPESSVPELSVSGSSVPESSVSGSSVPEPSVPEPAGPEPFLNWFMNFQNTFLHRLGRRYYTPVNKALRGSEANRKADIFLASANVTLPGGEYDWSNILVIGEYRMNPIEDRSVKTLVRLAGYVRQVLISQPGRRFVPGFIIYGSLMRLWVFDRSGLYSSEKFDIHKEPERFVKVFAGYTLMTDAELGLNTFIKRYGNGIKYIVARGERICLEYKPIAFTKAIVGRGTTCFRGRRIDSREWEYVVKFAWSSDNSPREGQLLKMARERGVTGIATWFSHEEINIDRAPDTIAHLRRAMIFGPPRSPTDYESATTYDNRVNYCLVTSPVGRPLHTYQSVRELLEALRDAIRGHRSLLAVGKILHRDISENNIIITAGEGGSKGRLIDLDMAEELDGISSGRTGTVQFMAIGVLEGQDHTYRHDLESFLYVLLWICIRDSYENPGRQKLIQQRGTLEGWCNGGYEHIAQNKAVDMIECRFERVIAQFAPKFEKLKGLARVLRCILFCTNDFVFANHNIIYDKIIDGFNGAINGLGAEGLAMV